MMHKLSLYVQASLFIALTLASCSQKSNEPQPPEIIYGQDVCAACGMVIDQPRSASAILLNTGEYLKFDDIGDMIVFPMDRPDKQPAAWFVHDANSEEWIRAETAYYVVSPEIRTPMGYGILAFSNEQSAEEYATPLTEAKVMDFDEVRADIHVKTHE
jgi:copper chaperone NosL